MRGSLAFAFALVASAVAVSSGSSARADDSLVDARADYDAAAAAYDRGDHATAAVRFARADERVPNPRALRLAMSAALLASDAGLAMNLVERSEERARGEAPDPKLAELTRDLRRRFEHAAGRIRVACPVGEACHSSIDGEPIDVARPRWVAPGYHLVALETGAGVAPVNRNVAVRAGETVEVVLAAANVDPNGAMRREAIAPATTPDDATSPERSRAGLPPAIFWSALAATGVGIGVSTVLTVDVVNRHDAFVDRPSAGTADSGAAAQTRARVAWAVSGVFALTTVVLGAMTDFRGRRADRPRSTAAFAARPSPRCSVSVGPLGAGLAGTFW